MCLWQENGKRLENHLAGALTSYNPAITPRACLWFYPRWNGSYKIVLYFKFFSLNNALLTLHNHWALFYTMVWRSQVTSHCRAGDWGATRAAASLKQNTQGTSPQPQTLYLFNSISPYKSNWKSLVFHWSVMISSSAEHGFMYLLVTAYLLFLSLPL